MESKYYDFNNPERLRVERWLAQAEKDRLIALAKPAPARPATTPVTTRQNWWGKLRHLPKLLSTRTSKVG